MSEPTQHTPSSTNDTPDALKEVWLSNGLPEEFLAHLKLTGNPDKAVPSSFRVGLAAQIAVGLAGLSATYLHFLRTGIKQDVTVDARHAVLSFHSEAWYTIDEALPSGSAWDNIAGLYQTQDGGWVRIHTNFPHHRSGVLSILSIPDSPDHPATKAEVARAILQWNGQALEDECAKHNMCVFRLRTQDEWNSTEHAQAVANTPVVDVRKVGEATKRSQFGKAINIQRPLEGVRVLDLSRVLAGPVAGRALAAHGAQVLLITSPKLPSLPFLDTETSLGKRTTQINLTSPADRETFKDLVRNVDVLLQAYRPGGIAARGFGVADVLGIKATEENRNAKTDGVVYASLRAWGWNGPWADRRGFDSLVQTATGFNVDEANAYEAYLKSHGRKSEWAPRPLPMQALDHAAGYMLAFGINVALARMITKGQSHEVRVSLAATGKWIRSLGRLTPEEAFGGHAMPFPPRSWPLHKEISKLSVPWVERRGKDKSQDNVHRRRMTALQYPARLSVTPAREGVLEGENLEGDWGAPMRLDADDAVWSQ